MKYIIPKDRQRYRFATLNAYQKKYLNRLHALSGLRNAIWSDMFVESAFMIYGHVPGSLNGITLFPSLYIEKVQQLKQCYFVLSLIFNFLDFLGG